MIIRTIHNKDNPYFQLNRAAVNDERLSYKALGIHTYLMSKPDGWEANEVDIVNRHAEGRDSVRSGLKELAQYGYLHRTRVTDKAGKVVEWRIDVYETPGVNPFFALAPVAEVKTPPAQVTENPQLENQESGKPDYWKTTLWENQNVENPIHSNYINTVTNELKGACAQPEAPQPATPSPLPLSAPSSTNGFDALLNSARQNANGTYGQRREQVQIDDTKKKIKAAGMTQEQFNALVDEHLTEKGTKSLADGDSDMADDELRTARKFVLELISTGRRFRETGGIKMLWNSWRTNDKRPSPSESQLVKHAHQMVNGKIGNKNGATSNGAKPAGVYVGVAENLK